MSTWQFQSTIFAYMTDLRLAIQPRDGPIWMAEYDVLEVAQTSCASHYDVAISCAIYQSTVDIGN